MLAVFVLFVLVYLLYCYFLVCLLVTSKIHHAKCSFTRHSLKLIPILPHQLSNLFLRTVFFFLSLKHLIGLCPQLLNSIRGLRRNDLKVFSLSNRLLVGIGGIILGIDVKELRFGRCPDSLFDLRFIKFRTRMFINLGVDSSMYLLS